MLVPGWNQDLFKLAPLPHLTVGVRMGVVVGMPLVGGVTTGNTLPGVIAAACGLLVTLADTGTTRMVRVGTMAAAGFAILGGGTVGALFGGTTYADEGLVLLTAFIAGWVSASHSGIAAVARLLRCRDRNWLGHTVHRSSRRPRCARRRCYRDYYRVYGLVAVRFAGGRKPVDWRTGLRRALGGVGAGPRYAICYAMTACVALFFAQFLGVSRSYWATVAVLLVMRREGTVSLKMIVQYMLGTLTGILAAALIVHLVANLKAIALIAVAFAASARLGLARNPALGFIGFTVFFMLNIDVALQGEAIHSHLLSSRLYDVAVGCVLALFGTLIAALSILAHFVASALTVR